MCKITVNKDCTDYENIKKCADAVESYIHSLVKKFQLDSLQHIFVTDPDSEKYSQTVKICAVLINANGEVTNDDNYMGAGKTLEGINNSGDYEQIIVVKSFVIVKLFCELFQIDISEQEMGLDNSAQYLIMHEIGHAFYNQFQYNITGKLEKKIVFDLHSEADEYISECTKSVWEEYYAEAFALTHMSENNTVFDREKDVIECIKNYSRAFTIKAVAERVNKILYLYMHCLAFKHTRNKSCFDYDKYEKEIYMQKYIVCLAEIEKAIIKIHSDSMDSNKVWSEDEALKELRTLYKKMFEIEMAQI